MLDDVFVCEDTLIDDRDPADFVIEQDIIEESDADDELLSGADTVDDDLLDQVGDCDAPSTDLDEI